MAAILYIVWLGVMLACGCADWCTSALFKESHASEARFNPDDGVDPNDDGTKDPPHYLQAMLDALN